MSKINPFFASEPLSTAELIDFFHIPHFSQKAYPKDHCSIPYSYCKKHLVLPIYREDKNYIVVTCDPFRLEVQKELSFMLDAFIDFHYLEEQALIVAIDQYFHQQEDKASKWIEELSDDQDLNDENDLYDLLDKEGDESPSIHLLNSVIKEAIQQGASDIHFEPIDDTFSIRYRIDGVLQSRHKISAHYRSLMTSRLKLMAELDIAESRRPQDGRIKLKVGQKEVDFRMSTIPIAHGERIVLRILDKNNLTLGLNHMEMPQELLNSFNSMIRRSEGIILVTGPTGSGKTTTLYSTVTEINSDCVNIMTIEDPVEYKLSGIAQMGVQPKIDLTFAKGLRHILRQDPDVILIGEIRDLETAQIAIQSALTGHLVLSTLHTNDAPSAIARLVDMGIEPYLLSSCVIGILAQRLIRTICPDCRISYTPSPKHLEMLSFDKKISFYKGKGCSSCHQTGYRGRRGIFELMPISGEVKKQISNCSDSQSIKEVALQEGMKTLRHQGCQLIEQGITTVDEVLRVALGMEDL